MSKDGFWAYQRSAFKRLYEHARTRVAYYRDRPREYPPRIGDSQNVLEILTRLPVLGKQSVREHNEQFWARPAAPFTWLSTTTGTTGTPLRLARSLWERGFGENVEREWLRRISGSRYPRTLLLTGMLVPDNLESDLYWHDRVFGDVYLSIYALGPNFRDPIVDLVKRFRPECVYGYTSSVNQLASLVGDAVQSVKDRCVAVTTCEVLQPSWRENIEANLCSRLFDLYGSQESCHRVDQCCEGRMHINPLIGIVEIVDDQGLPVKRGEIGRVLVTGLVCKSMPLIRYEIGDSALSTGYAADCPCGLAWPTIGHIEGRSEDLVRTRDGRVISVLCDRITKGVDGIEECQLIQKDYEQFVLKIVRNMDNPEHYMALEEDIRTKMGRRLHTDFEIEFEYVDSIPRGKRGKFKAVVSEVGSGPEGRFPEAH